MTDVQHVSALEAVLAYEVAGPAHLCFNIEAAHVPTQRILSEALEITPAVPVRRFTDPATGNRLVRFDAQAGPLRMHYQARVALRPPPPAGDLPEVPVSALPDEVLHHLMPSRYCESDLMARGARQLFGQLPPGIARVRAIVDWIHDTIEYLPGSSDSTTTAQQVFVQRAGVCRDFAHLGITFCRALNIPARLVVGYVLFDEPPQDFHAIFEAWLGGRWVLFDPSGMAPVERLVRVGTGTDAKDVAFATLFGPVQMRSKDLRVRESGRRAPPVLFVAPAASA
jgi:transglutaminase-like putative cysteine protease